MRLKKLLGGIKVKIDPCLQELEVTSVVTNSKDVKKGSLFVAIKGSKFDGHRFVEEAFQKGAAVFIVERKRKTAKRIENLIKVKDTRKALSVIAKNFYRSPSEKLKVIGITGTNGKTTIAFLIESIFNKTHIPCGLIGTIECRIGKCRMPAENTTPDALSTNILLDKMLKSSLKTVAMEVSSHALDQKRVDDIFFDAAIFTNLTHEHLDYHGNLARYFASKVKIFKNLKKGGFAIINIDDKNARAALRKIVGHKKITYGLNKAADVSANVERLELDGSSFSVKIHKKDVFSVNTKLVGLHNISNILAAVAASITQDINLRAIKKGIEKLDSIPGRLEPVDKGQKFKVFIDYAHTHNALENVLKFLNQIKQGNIITVFGCGGNRDKKKRPLMGDVAQKYSSSVIITNDNPRNEDPKKIVHDIEAGMNKENSNYTVILNRKKAIEKALKMAMIGDIVLIAGKGHEKVQIVGKRSIPFDDKRVAEGILRRGTKDDGRRTK